MKWSLRRKKTGETGEEIAARLLWKKGFRIIERNYRCEVGEIDVIAEDRGVVVFVEVKTRKSPAGGAPEEAVDRDKRRRILRAAEWYLKPWARWPQSTRFDIVGIELDENDAVKAIRHTPAAFEPE
ncbi:MAG: YraN family protein [Candidatus Sumerlaeia bacterium]|nr:YraN family protein [Candidatus Sumerlaeia bacterium]